MKRLNHEVLRKEIEATVQADLDSNTIGGASVLVFQDGNGPRFEGCYGKTNTETGEAMTPEAVFRLASMTKPVTAAAVLILVQRGLLKLEDPVYRYLPAYRDIFVGRLENGKAVPDHRCDPPLAIWHLLTHTNGLMTCDPICLAQPPIPESEKTDLRRIVDYYPRTLLACDPMGKAAYSAFAAFDVAARIIEEVSGLSYPEFLQRNLFEPLSMHDTSFTPDEAHWARMTAMHNRVEGRNTVVPLGTLTFAEFSYISGGASLTATIGDYARFAEMLLYEGALFGRQILTPEMVRLMRKPWIPQTVSGSFGSETWGLGVRVITDDPVMTRGAYGWSGAYGTHFWVDPENRLYTVYAKNSYYDGGSGALTARGIERCVRNALDA